MGRRFVNIFSLFISLFCFDCLAHAHSAHMNMMARLYALVVLVMSPIFKIFILQFVHFPFPGAQGVHLRRGDRGAQGVPGRDCQDPADTQWITELLPDSEDLGGVFLSKIFCPFQVRFP